jgi:hypothetical protein
MLLLCKCILQLLLWFMFSLYYEFITFAQISFDFQLFSIIFQMNRNLFNEMF